MPDANGAMTIDEWRAANRPLPAGAFQGVQAGVSENDAYDKYYADFVNRNHIQTTEDRQRAMTNGYSDRDALMRQWLQQSMQNQQDLRQRQMSVADYLQGQMRGENSLSALQLRQGADRALAGQQALAASARPDQQAMAARMAMQNAGRIGMDLTGQTAMAGIAERNAAANALSGLLGQSRGQDIGLAQSNQNAQLQNAAGNTDYLRYLLQQNQQQYSQSNWLDKLLQGGSTLLPLIAAAA